MAISLKLKAINEVHIKAVKNIITRVELWCWKTNYEVSEETIIVRSILYNKR